MRSLALRVVDSRRRGDRAGRARPAIFILDPKRRPHDSNQRRLGELSFSACVGVEETAATSVLTSEGSWIKGEAVTLKRTCKGKVEEYLTDLLSYMRHEMPGNPILVTQYPPLHT